MKKKRKAWPRWAKVTRNLLLAALLVLTVWDQLDRPLPYEAALRREERQFLVPETEHHLTVSRGIWGTDMRLNWTEGAAMAFAPFKRYYFFDFGIYVPYGTPHRLTEGTNLIPMPSSVVSFGTDMRIYIVYAAIQPPEESVSAVLTVHNKYGTFTAEGTREEDAFLFYIPPPEKDGTVYTGEGWRSKEEFSYELVFYDESGKLILETSG